MSRPVSSRRNFLRQAGSSVLLGVAGVGSAGDGARVPDPANPLFLHGVASGDPLSDRVILWTRVSVEAAVEVGWAVALDADMRKVVASGSARAVAERDFTVKVDVSGLLPGQTYFYRFLADGIESPVGRTRTLPAAGVEQVRLAVFSCANYPAGYFHAYADAALRDDIDAAVHLGDYIYEYERTGYACGKAAALGRLSEPPCALMALDDYRTRYAQYRGDRDLQALHAAVPMIAVWDDHEFADDTWRDGAAGHEETPAHPFAARKAAAIQAYHEWMPIRSSSPDQLDHIYRSFDFGQLLSLHMLDTRLVGRDKQLDMADFCDAKGRFDAGAYHQALASPARSMMGQDQLQWLEQQCAASSARWQVLGQQVLMAPMEFPLPVACGELSVEEYATLKEVERAVPERLSAAERAQLCAPSLPCYLDSWDGYPHTRAQVFDIMRRQRKNLVVLAGDSHNAWASNLHDARGQLCGVEFAVPSVSSPGLECRYPDTPAPEVARMYQQAVPSVFYAQTSKRGYLLLTATDTEVRADWRFVSTVEDRNYQAVFGRSLRTFAGPGRQGLQDCASLPCNSPASLL
ncbi:MAG: alkaline phosphatase D family protein [Pseudomonadota bacterium]